MPNGTYPYLMNGNPEWDRLLKMREQGLDQMLRQLSLATVIHSQIPGADAGTAFSVAGPLLRSQPEEQQQEQDEWEQLRYTDRNHLLGAADFYGIDNPKRMRPDELETLVEQRRDLMRDPDRWDPTKIRDWKSVKEHVYDSFATAIGVTGTGVAGAVLDIVQSAPFAGDAIARLEGIQQADRWVAKLNEGFTAEMSPTERKISTGMTGLIGFALPAATSWKLMGLAGELPGIATQAARISPVARGAVRGLMSQALLTGGGDAPMQQRALDAAFGLAFGAGGRIGGAIGRTVAGVGVGAIAGSLADPDDPRAMLIGAAAGAAAMNGLPLVFKKVQRSFPSRSYGGIETEFEPRGVWDEVLVEQPTLGSGGQRLLGPGGPELPSGPGGPRLSGGPASPLDTPLMPRDGAPLFDADIETLEGLAGLLPPGTAPQSGPSLLMQTPPEVRRFVRRVVGERRAARRLAETDPLTGAGNRLAWQRARASAETDPSQAIVVFDVNNLKAANDIVGHEFGDSMIKNAAQATAQAAQHYGIPNRLFRLGGDEFAAIVPVEHAETYRVAVEEFYGSHEAGQFKVSITGAAGHTLGEADSELNKLKLGRRGTSEAYRPMDDPAGTAVWQARIEELDALRAPDTEYRGILSTGSKEPLNRGETWRDRVLNFISYRQQKAQAMQVASESLKPLGQVEAADEAAALTKTASIMESPALAELSGQIGFDDADVAQAVVESYPGHIGIVRNVGDAGKTIRRILMEQMPNGVGPQDFRLVKRVIQTKEQMRRRALDPELPSSYKFVPRTATEPAMNIPIYETPQYADLKERVDTDLLVTSGRPITQAMVKDYETYGMFSGQRATTAQGNEVTILAVGPETSTVVPLHGGSESVVPTADLLPSKSSGIADIEAPDFYTDFEYYAQVKLAEQSDALGIPRLDLYDDEAATQLPLLMDEYMKLYGPQNFRLVQRKPVKLYRGAEQPLTAITAPVNTHSASEGVGIYATMNRDLASSFGTVSELYVQPTRTIHADELYLLDEGSQAIFEPIQPSDSEWLQLHKLAVQQTGVTPEKWDELAVQERLTTLLKERGYGAVDVLQANHPEEYGWKVYLDPSLVSLTPMPAQTDLLVTSGREGYYGATLRALLEHSYLSQLRSMAPLEDQVLLAEATKKLRIARLSQGMPAASLEELAEGRGMRWIRSRGEAGELRDNFSDLVVPVNTEEAAREFLQGFDRELPDVTPAMLVPLELAGSPIGYNPASNLPNRFSDVRDWNRSMEATLLSEQDINVALREAASEGGGGGPPEPPIGAGFSEEEGPFLPPGHYAVGDPRYAQHEAQWAGLLRDDEAAYHTFNREADDLVSRYMRGYRHTAISLEQRAFALGVDEAKIWSAYEDVERAHTIAITKAVPWQQRITDINAKIRSKYSRDGTFYKVYTAPRQGIGSYEGSREQLIKKYRFTPSEIEAIEDLRQFTDDFHAEVRQTFPGIGYIEQYWPTIIIREPIPEGASSLPDELTWQRQLTRTKGGSVDNSLVSAFNGYVRSFYRYTEMKQPYEVMKRLFNQPSVPKNLKAFANTWLEARFWGIDPSQDKVIRSLRDTFGAVGIPLTHRDVSKFIGIGFTAQYRGMLGGRVAPIVRDLLQMLVPAARLGNFKLLGEVLHDFIRNPQARREMIEWAYTNGTLQRDYVNVSDTDLFSNTAYERGGTVYMQFTPAEEARREALATAGDALSDKVLGPLRLRAGITGTPLDMLYFYQKQGNLARIVSGEMGRRQALHGIQEYLALGSEAQPEQLLRSSGVLSFQAPIKRKYLEHIEAGDFDAAARMFANKVADLQNRYGATESPVGIREAGTFGRLAMQLGTHQIQQVNEIIQIMNDSSIPRQERYGFAMRMAAIDAALGVGKVLTGWNLRKLMYTGGLITPLAAPTLWALANDAQRALAKLHLATGDPIGPDQKALLGAEGAPGTGLIGSFNPLAGFTRSVEGFGQVTNNAHPVRSTLRFMTTGQRGDPVLDRQMQHSWTTEPSTKLNSPFIDTASANPLGLDVDSLLRQYTEQKGGGGAF